MLKKWVGLAGILLTLNTAKAQIPDSARSLIPYAEECAGDYSGYTIKQIPSALEDGLSIKEIKDIIKVSGKRSGSALKYANDLDTAYIKDIVNASGKYGDIVFRYILEPAKENISKKELISSIKEIKDFSTPEVTFYHTFPEAIKDDENTYDILEGIRIADKYSNLKQKTMTEMGVDYSEIRGRRSLAEEIAEKLNQGKAENQKKAAKLIDYIHDTEWELYKTDLIRDNITDDLEFKAIYDMISSANDTIYESTFKRLHDNLPEDITDSIRKVDSEREKWIDFVYALSSRGYLEEIIDEDKDFFFDALIKGLKSEDQYKLIRNGSFAVKNLERFFGTEYSEQLNEFLEKRFRNADKNIEKGVYGFMLKKQNRSDITKTLPEIPLSKVPDEWSERDTLKAVLVYYPDEEWFSHSAHSFNNGYGMKLTKNGKEHKRLTKEINDKHIMIELVKDKNVAQKIKDKDYIMIAHRGHSPHQTETFSVPSDRKMIAYSGDCGSAQDIVRISLMYPNSFPILIRGTGKGAQNNHIIYNTMKGIAQGKKDWKKFDPYGWNTLFPNDTQSNLIRYSIKFGYKPDSGKL
ncbi:MAG: hypothetical protein ACQEP1_01445 [Nanobdellota archaeon]